MTTPNDASDRAEPSDRCVLRSKVVAAPAAAIFDLLADPAKHHLFDGSGTVVDARESAPTRLKLGTKFSMDMHMGVKYRMTNKVVEFEENRRIGWTHFGGHIWRYELEVIDEGSTKVTESFDWSQSPVGFIFPLIGAPSRNAAAIESTLDRLADVLDTPDAP